MACSSPERSADGFATASAMLICASLAAVTAGVMGLTVAELRRSRAALAQTQDEYALAGAQTLAAAALMQTNETRRFQWSLDAGQGQIEVIAEPEAQKASYRAAAAWDEQTLARLGVRDAASLRQSLSRLDGAPPARQWLGRLDSAPLWRACAQSVISPFGRGEALGLQAAKAPAATGDNGRVGEIWRIRAAKADGWADDRLIRFTGDPDRPVAAIQQQFGRTGIKEGACEAAIGPGA